jgi:hypothetical protein
LTCHYPPIDYCQDSVEAVTSLAGTVSHNLASLHGWHAHLHGIAHRSEEPRALLQYLGVGSDLCAEYSAPICHQQSAHDNRRRVVAKLRPRHHLGRLTAASAPCCACPTDPYHPPPPPSGAAHPPWSPWTAPHPARRRGSTCTVHGALDTIINQRRDSCVHACVRACVRRTDSDSTGEYGLRRSTCIENRFDDQPGGTLLMQRAPPRCTAAAPHSASPSLSCCMVCRQQHTDGTATAPRPR